ncbi:MAG: 1-acyl-sn-glycerol-3-phosphate acyltransferase [Clostridia bacterium]|nr:1-acyl-sn-glycerol-3-phosphate acyltransferase [Clostridia bacterium]
MSEKNQKKESVNLPKRGIYGLALKAARPFIIKKFGVTIKKEGVENLKPPYVVLANHLSRIDWLLVGISFWPDVLNVVVSRYYYSNPKLRPLLKLTGAIPKDQFAPDLAAVRNIMSVIKRGGVVMLFPEGRTTPHGLSETFEYSTVKLLKHLGVPVVCMHQDGTHLSNPKWASDYRRGRIDITVKPLFEGGELKKMDEDEIFARMCATLYSDEYKWQEKNHVLFKSKHIAKGLDGVLYKCPKCGADFTTVADDTSIRCEACGNGATLDNYYNLTPFDKKCVIPKNIGQWFLWQKQQERLAISQNEHFLLTDGAVFREAPSEGKPLEPVGKGTITLNREGLFYSGTRHGEYFELLIPLAALPAVPYVPGRSFEVYYNKAAYSFIPDNKKSTQRWSLVAEQLYDQVIGTKNSPL